MRKEEKKVLIMLADSLLRMYEMGLLEQSHVKALKETFEGLEVEKEDDWDKIMEDNFHSFLKHVHGLHNMAKAKETHDEMKEDTTCDRKCKEGASECEFDYIYTVHLGKERLDVCGNSWSLDDHDNLRIYSDTDQKKVRAFFQNVQGFTISEVEDD